MIRIWIAGILIATVFLAGSVFSLGYADSLGAGRPGPGDSAPLFTADDLNGRRTSLDEILKSGNVVLLNFWGLRCTNCITEIGYLNPMYERYKDKGVAFMGVNVDGAKAEIVSKFMANLPHVPRYTVLADPDFKIPDLYNLAGAPLSLVIGRDGRITYRHEDFQEGDEKEMETALMKAIARENPAPSR